MCQPESVITDPGQVQRLNSMFNVHAHRKLSRLSKRIGTTEAASYTAMDGKVYAYTFLDHSITIYDLYQFQSLAKQIPGFIPETN